jgi:hypothetical protein
MLMRSTHVEECGVHQTESDPSIYIKIVCEEKEDKGDASDSVLDPADKEAWSALAKMVLLKHTAWTELLSSFWSSLYGLMT